jgi:hypothetical protein
MARLEAAYSTETPSMSYRTAEGEMIYALSLRNFLSTSIGAINGARSYTDLAAIPEFQQYNVENNPYIKYSMFFNTMFDLNTGKRRTVSIDNVEEPIQLILGNYNGLKIKGKRDIANSNTSLNARQKIIFDMNSLLTKGALEIMRTESSASSFFIKLNSYRNGSNLPIKIEQFSAGFRSPAFMDQIITYAAMELYRIKNFADETDVSSSIKAASKGFYFMRDVLSDKTANGEALKDKLKEEIKTKSVRDVINNNRAEMEKAVEAFFNRQLISLRRSMANENVDSADLDAELIRRYNDNPIQLLRAFIANSFILNTEFVILFDGDLVYQEDYKDYFKRAKGDISTGKTPMIDEIFANHMRARDKATFAGFLGTSHLNDYRTVRSVVIDDYKTSSSYVDHDIIADNLRKVRPSITQEEIDKVLEKYNDLTVGDGQGHITLDFYRQFLKSISNWSTDQEITYQKELAWFRLNYSSEGEYSEAQRQRDLDYMENNKDVNSYFPPLKIQYNGPIKAKGTFVKVLDKFSVAPLIPSVIRGSRWEQINIDLIKNGIGYTKFKSGTKKYKHSSVGMYNNGAYSSFDLSNYTPSIHYLTYLKEQINTSPNVKEESTFGSQVRKLILANLFSRGVSSEKNQKRLERYIGLMKDIVELEKKKLFDEIGLKIIPIEQYAQDPRFNEGKLDLVKLSGKTKVVVDDASKFVKMLQRQAELRDLNDNIKDYIQYDKDSKLLVNPLEASLNRSQIQDLIMGIIDNRLRKLKINGDQLIQISSAGFESNNFKYKEQTKEEVLQNGTNGLKFYTLKLDKDGNPIKINPMEVKVALVGGFEKLLNLRHPDKKPIGTIERLNSALKDANWANSHEKHLTIVGYRIPTQGPNSIEVMRIAEFIHPSAGSSIILPAEIVAKAGSDYDIDKMFVFRPSFNEDGSLVNKNTTDEGDMKNYFTNQIIDLFAESMSDPEMYEQLITPNNTELVKPVALDVAIALGKKKSKEAAPYQGTQILRYISNLRKFESLLSGKKLLGIFAVNNTFSQLLQQSGVTMNVNYGRNKSKVAKLFLLTPEERKKVLSEDGKRIDLSDNKDVTGVYKQEYFSQLINATVDIASDDFIGYVNLSYENAGVLSLLINQGVPFERALWFVNQPTIVRYYNELRAKAGERNRYEIQADILKEYGETGLFNPINGKVDRDTLTQRIQRIIKSPLISDKYYISLNYMKTAATPKRYKELLSKSNDDQKAQLRDTEKLIFAYFLSLQDQAQQVQNFRSVLNYDTTKFATPLDIVSSWFKEKSLTDPKGEDNMFSIEDIENVSKKSVISPFSNKQLMWKVAQSMMPAGYNDMFLTLAAQKIGKIFGKRNAARASKIMSNDFIEWIVKNFGTRDGIPLRTLQQRMSRGPQSIARRLISLKATFPELVDKYVIFSRMKPNFPTSPVDRKDNIEVQRLFENTTSDQNRYIAEFRELINFSDDRYTKDQQLSIQNFFKDAALYSFLQSGFNRSNISFQELVPQETLSEIFTDTIRTFLTEIAPNKKLVTDFVKAFIRSFESKHKRLFFSTAAYVPTWRGKEYQMPSGLNPQIDRLIPKSPKVEIIKPEKVVDIPHEEIIVRKPSKPTESSPQERTQEIRDIFSSNDVFKRGLTNIKVPDQILQKLISAQMQIWDENIRSASQHNIGYWALPFGLNEDQMVDIFENKAKEFKRELNLGSFADMLKYYDEYGDDALDWDGEVNLDTMIAQLIEIELPISSGITSLYDSLAHLYKAYFNGEIEDEDENKAAEAYLNKYDLLTYRDPNQLSLFDENQQPKVPVTEIEKEQSLEKPKYRIAMKFKDGTGGRQMRPEFRGKSTLQLIKEGKRTATSRDRSKSYNQQDIQVGDIIEFYDDEGGTSLVRVTKSPYPLSEVTAEEWSKLEGWMPDRYEELRKAGYEQFTFELILPSKTDTFAKARDQFKSSQTPTSVSLALNFEQHSSSNYADRTRENAAKSDVTIAIATDFTTAGEKATKFAVDAAKKMYLGFGIGNSLSYKESHIKTIVDRIKGLNKKSVVINIAGNGIYTLKDKYSQEEVDKFTKEFLGDIVQELAKSGINVSIRTGGQTGFDEAGAKAGIALGLPTTILAPKGWKMRDASGKDISDEHQFKSRFNRPGKSMSLSLGIKPKCY